MGKIKYYFQRIKGMGMKNLKFAINGVHKRSGKNKILIFLDMCYCTIRYNAGYMDYYYYFFESSNKKQRRSYITRGINNSYIRKLNNQKFGYIFDDKIKFNEAFKDYIGREYLDLRKTSLEDFKKFIKKHEWIVLKPIDLQCGKNIEKINTKEVDAKKLYESCKEKGQLLIEECITQHSKINELYPNSVNTLRIVTACKDGKTTIMFRCIRIGNGGNVVDNFNHGGMYSIINQYGVINKPAIDKKSNIYTTHPETGTVIEGFEIPYFDEAINMCEKASHIVPEIGLVGWDVAITPNGPVLVEGNNFPGYDIYQSRVHLNDDGTGIRPFFDEVILGKHENSKLRFFVAMYYYKIFLWFQKLMGKQNKIYPGYTAKLFKICPSYLRMIAKPKKIICVMGTNGKTTLCNLIKDVLNDNGYSVINNIEFSLKTGISHCFTRYATLTNKSKYDFAVIETDELTSGQIYKYLTPDYVVCTNLFRDSLKKNGNSEYMCNIMKNSIPASSKLILNADDLISSSLKNNFTKFYGIDKLDTDLKESPNIVKDIVICPKCYTKLKYEYNRYNHIGKAYCPKCDFKSYDADYRVTNFDDNSLVINGNKYSLISDSIFNIYNELAAISVLSEIGLDTKKIQKSIKKIKITDSRQKNYKVMGKDFICILAKGQNPVACSSVINYVSKKEEMKDVILMLDDLEDNYHSSETISWLYDTDFEFLNKDNIRHVIVGGPRCYDMQVRLLLAGISESKIKITEKQEDIVNLVDMDGIDTLYYLYDLVALEMARGIEQNIIRKFGA